MQNLLIAILASFWIATIIRLFKDLSLHKEDLKKEGGSIPRYICIELVVMFLACAGISDTALNIFAFRKLDGHVPDRLLPGTVVCGAFIPVCLMGMSYTSIIKVDLKLLASCAIASSVGSILGVRLIAGWDERIIRLVMGIALAISAALILFRIFFSD